MEFRREVVDPDPPGRHNVICLATDLTGDGTPDVLGETDAEFGRVDVWYNER